MIPTEANAARARTTLKIFVFIGQLLRKSASVRSKLHRTTDLLESTRRVWSCQHSELSIGKHQHEQHYHHRHKHYEQRNLPKTQRALALYFAGTAVDYNLIELAVVAIGPGVNRQQ